MNAMKKISFAEGYVTVGGQPYILKPGVEQFDNILSEFVCKQPAEGFYDWTITLKNTGAKNTNRITDFCGLYLFLPLAETETFTYNGLRGDDSTVDSFAPETATLVVGDVLTKAPFGGRSSDTSAFPYFDLSMKDYSIVCGIGWSGQWKLNIERTREGVLLKVGQEDCDMILYPGEAIRSVRILLWAGATDTCDARQKFVVCHRQYASPFAQLGIDYECPISSQSFDRYFWTADTGDGKIPFFETEEAQLKLCENGAKCEYFNTFWLDACWFKDTFRNGVGNYTVYSAGFPNGLHAIADAVHKNNQQFIVWFEPVRVNEGTEAWNRFANNPKQVIRLEGCKRLLLNIGDPEVWEWVYDQIVTVMECNGIDCYREDFNISPLGYLRTLDEEDRKGMAEMRFVEGLYRLWDALRAHFPGLLIDNCASGGRLLDVETCSRAFSLWQSDIVAYIPDREVPSGMIQQNQNLVLSRYIPHHQGCASTTDAYTVRSAATYGIACEFEFLENHFDVQAAKSAVAEARMMSRYWKGDFTPLTDFSKATDVFSAYALKKSSDEGMIAVFRRPDVAFDTFVVSLSNMQPDASYKIIWIDEERKETTEIVKGSVFTHLPVYIAKAPASMLVLWKKI